jgi:hypothetical protein
MAGRVLVASDLPGFAPRDGLEGGTSARSWMAPSGLPASEQAKEARKLEALTFVRGARERLGPTSGGQSEALSIVMQFRSPRGALANVSDEVRGEEAHGAKGFAVPRIPGARGFGGVNGANTGYNVAFADGTYYYLVGAGYPTGSPGAPTQQDLIVAAQHLYARVHH